MAALYWFSLYTLPAAPLAATPVPAPATQRGMGVLLLGSLATGRLEAEYLSTVELP